MSKRRFTSDSLNEDIIKVIRKTYETPSLTQSLIQELTPIGKEITYNPSDYILRTGDLNDSFFILLKGSLSIKVDDEIITNLKRRGDIVGEMSIISQNICSADVIANTTSVILKVNAASLKTSRSDYELMLYKIFCLSLSEKLENTNIKARNFETLNRTLESEVERRTQDLKEKNNELTLGYKKLENMHTENILMVNKLSTLDDEYLKTSLKALDKLDIQDNSLEIIKVNLKLIQASLSPMKKLKSEQDQLEGQSALIVETNNKQRNLIKMALSGTGVQVALAKTVEEALEALKTKYYDILFLATDMLEVADFVRDQKIKSKIVLSTEEESHEYLTKIKDYGFLSNIIATKEDDRAFNIKSISTTVRKMTCGDIFGLEKYLNWGVEVKELEIYSSKERQNINDKVIEQLGGMGIRGGLKTRCQIVIEELLMNAIYDAPVDKKGKPLHNFKSRSETVLLTREQTARLRFATDGLFLAISVEDPFGVFKKETIFQYLQNNYFNRGTDEHEKSGKGGAGKGLYMITENSDLVIYNVAPGLKTEVIALFDLDTTKDRKNTSLHYFEL